MASPSSLEGLSKSQIEKRLIEMRKQYEIMQKKLEKSEKAARAKSHVKKKIADYRSKQSNGGSPECTLEKSHKTVYHHVEAFQESPISSRTTNTETCTSSDLKPAVSIEKSSKRRSVSFHIADKEDLPGTCEKKEELPETKIVGATNRSGEEMACDADSNSTHRFVARTGSCFDGADTSRKQGHSAMTFGEREKSMKSSASSGKSLRKITHIVLPEDSDHCDLTRKPEEVNTPRQCTTDIDLNLQSAMKTPPEDTQFDLFADSDTPFQSSASVAVPLNSADISSNVPMVKVVSSKGSVTAPALLEGFDDSETDTLIRHSDEASSHADQGVVQPGTSQPQGFEKINQSPMKCVHVLDTDSNSDSRKTSDVCATHDPLQHSPTGTDEAESLRSYTELPENVSQTDRAHMESSCQERVQERSEDNFMNSSTEDPDIIPGTYSSEAGTLPGSSAQRQRLSHAALTADNLDNSRKRRSTEGKCAITAMTKPTNMGITPSVQTDAGLIVSSNCKEHISKMDREESCVTGPNDQPVEQVPLESPSRRTSDIASLAVPGACPENDPDSQTTKVLPKTMGKRKGRRKSTINMDNLCMDDVRLKDFVLSQQSSKEGVHSWIDGLMYPAEYYVRRTRSMSKYSPDQHSAPITKRECRRKETASGDMEKIVYSESLNHAECCKITEAPDIHARKEVVSPHHISEASDMSQDLCYSSTDANKESNSSKIKVSRKPATAARKKRGCKKVTQKIDGKESGTVNHGEDVMATPRNTEKDPSPVNKSKVTEKLTISQVSHNPMESQYMESQFPSQVSMPRLFCSPNAERSKMRGKPASTQASLNPLESQFTQTQAPSEIAMPRVFGSQSQFGLSLASQSSSFGNAPQTVTGTPLESQVVLQTDSNPLSRVEVMKINDEQLVIGRPEQQGELQAYLADVVPKTANAHSNSDKTSIQSASIAAFRENTDLKGVSIVQDQRHDKTSHVSQDGFIAGSQSSDVSMLSVSQEVARTGIRGTGDLNQPTCNLPGDLNQPTCNLPGDLNQPTCDLPGDLNQPSWDLPGDLPPIRTDMSSTVKSPPAGSTVDFPSSHRSNVDQGSPLTDAATGTPPEVAEMPVVSSQCTESLRCAGENDDSKQVEKVEKDMAVRRKLAFQFRGCLEHLVEGTSNIETVSSSSMIIDGVSVVVTAVHFPNQISVWSHDVAGGGQEYKLLSSWKTKPGEVIGFICPCPGADGYFEAVIVIRGNDGSETVRMIRLDVENKGTWEEKMLLNSAVMGQRPCTALCVIPGRWIAVAVINPSGGSDILYSRLGKIGEPLEVVGPARDSSISSLTTVESAPDMIIGLTSSEAFLWHLSSGRLLQVFSLTICKVTKCIQATAESGLLFLVASAKGALGQRDQSSDKHSPSCCLLTLNPATGRSARLLDYTAPCLQDSTRIVDACVRGSVLAVCLSSGIICLWDLFSGKLLLSSRCGTEQEVSSVCLPSAGTLLTACGRCVNVFDRDDAVSDIHMWEPT